MGMTIPGRSRPPVPADRITHPIEPVFDRDSRVLILGTMPSPRSRDAGFYYMHPGNRFWPVLAAVFEPRRYEEGLIPSTLTERRAFALSHGIALWDVLASCSIRGAEDGSIRDPVANDLDRILLQAPIRGIFTTGRTAHRLYEHLCEPRTGRKACLLPSPSGANCAVGMERLREAYAALLATAGEDGR